MKLFEWHYARWFVGLGKGALMVCQDDVRNLFFLARYRQAKFATADWPHAKHTTKFRRCKWPWFSQATSSQPSNHRHHHTSPRLSQQATHLQNSCKSVLASALLLQGQDLHQEHTHIIQAFCVKCSTGFLSQQSWWALWRGINQELA